jgi:hypothetical protein
MIAVPADTPVTTPVALTVAFAGVELVHVPPVVALVNVVVPPGATVVAPVVVLTIGIALTVITLVAAAMPQLLLSR